MSKFCPHCGVRVSRAESQFCAVCGHSLKQQAPQSNVSPVLIIQRLGSAPKPIPLTKPLIAIGREPGNDITLADVIVSRSHAALEKQGQDYLIADLGSLNGTKVNGQQLTVGQKHLLRSGDIIRIGDEQGNSVSLSYYQSGDDLGIGTGTINLGTTSLKQIAVSTIGRDASNHIQLDHPVVSKTHAEVRLTPSGQFILRDLNSTNGTFVNERPLRGPHTLKNGDKVQIGPFKLAYQNGELTRFTPGGNYRLDGLMLRREVRSYSHWSINRLRHGPPLPVAILDDISLSTYPKEFVALVGGSGAGKSTLMKALSGFAPADRGQVLVNGEDLYTNFGAYRSIMGYVPQDDIIHGQLTARSALNYAAQLRMPDASQAEIEQRILKVLGQVEMTDHADKQINTLSGGQRKRVSIAVELLAEPGLFFLDEPTSGLDPGLEKKMMDTLRDLADEGRTIVLVTHATANIDQCNFVGFLAYAKLAYFGPPGEAKAFFGAEDFADIYNKLALSSSSSQRPAQLYAPAWRQATPAGTATGDPEATLVKNEPQTAEEWAEEYRRSEHYQKYVANRLQEARRELADVPGQSERQVNRQRISHWHQFSVLAKRYFELILRDTPSLIILLVVMPLIGFLLLIMTDRYDLVGKEPAMIMSDIQVEIDESRLEQIAEVMDEQFQGTYVVAGAAQRLLFMLALAASLLGIFAAAYEIIKEQAIYRRERMINLRIFPYLSSKILILTLFALLQCFLLLFVVGLKVNYPAEGIFMPATLEMYITLLLATIASISLGLLISAVVRNGDTVIYVILVVLFIQIIFAGAIFDLPAAAKPISYLTTTRWTLEALGSTVDMESLNQMGVSCVEFEDEQSRLMVGQSEQPCIEGQMKQPALSTFNVHYEHSTGHLLVRWLVLLLFAVVFSSLAGFFQKRKDVI
jgi:ABC-type multidrug transport system ATPase subunit